MRERLTAWTGAAPRGPLLWPRYESTRHLRMLAAILTAAAAGLVVLVAAGAALGVLRQAGGVLALAAQAVAVAAGLYALAWVCWAIVETLAYLVVLAPVMWRSVRE